MTNSSGDAGYTDFTSNVVNVTAGGSTNFTLTPGFASSTYNEYWAIYADLNQDSDFDDAGEQLYSGASSSSVSGNISCSSSDLI